MVKKVDTIQYTRTVKQFEFLLESQRMIDYTQWGFIAAFVASVLIALYSGLRDDADWITIAAIICMAASAFGIILHEV